MDPIEELFKKMVSNPKDSLETKFKEVVKKEKAKQKEKIGYQNGAGYDYKKVWDEAGIGYRMVPTARVRMSEILGRPIGVEERVFIINKKLTGEAKYAPNNLLLGDSNGIRLDLLVCQNCSCQGNFLGTHANQAHK